MINLKFYPDFFCYSLWVLYDDGSVENIDPKILPISDRLKNDISRWEDEYDSIYNDNYPADSKFKSELDEELFFKQEVSLYSRLKKELSNEYMVNIGWHI